MFLFSYHFDNRLKKDGKDIDIVIGAKGSPLQIVLSTVYHIDIPTGNISYNKVKKYLNSPQIEYSIPLALGDNWNGYRIVGTNYDYIKHYKGELEDGREWNKNFEIVIVDDGSTDDTRLLVEQIREKAEFKVKYFYVTKHQYYSSMFMLTNQIRIKYSVKHRGHLVLLHRAVCPHQLRLEAAARSVRQNHE